jgi:hypothetical protein
MIQPHLELIEPSPSETLQDQEYHLQTVAARFAIVGNLDAESSAQCQLLETGEPWRIEAAALAASAAQTIIYSGQVHRKLSIDELTYLEAKHGFTNARNEYDAARLVAENSIGFVPLEKEENIPYGYQVAPRNKLIPADPDAQFGQLRRIGQAGGREVLLLRVDAETYIDQAKRPAQRYRPSTVRLLGIVSQVLEQDGDTSSRVALVTSASNSTAIFDVLKASVRYDRRFEIGVYRAQPVV